MPVLRDRLHAEGMPARSKPRGDQVATMRAIVLSVDVGRILLDPRHPTVDQEVHFADLRGGKAARRDPPNTVGKHRHAIKGGADGEAVILRARPDATGCTREKCNADRPNGNYDEEIAQEHHTFLPLQPSTRKVANAQRRPETREAGSAV